MSMEFLIDRMVLLKRSRDLFCRQVLEQYHLRASDMDVLLFLAGRGRACTAKEICEAYMAPKSLVSAAVDALSGRNLIDRAPHPQDKRSVLISLRPEADEILSALNARLEEFAARLRDGISADDLAVVETVFDRLHRNMNALGSAE